MLFYDDVRMNEYHNKLPGIGIAPFTSFKHGRKMTLNTRSEWCHNSAFCIHINYLTNTQICSNTCTCLMCVVLLAPQIVGT